MKFICRYYAHILALFIVAFFLFYRLGNDSVTTDDTHFKNWSYVFMKEYESGNFDALYVTVQPGALTIYSNIIGFKSLYFLRDKMGFFENLSERELDLTLHTFSKIPKSVLVLTLLVITTMLLINIFNENVGLIFLVLFGLESFVLGNSRAIQTDIIPAYLIFISALLFLKNKVKNYKNGLFIYILICCILGISNIEKASSVIALPIFALLIFIYEKGLKQKLLACGITVVSFFITMFAAFPTFWGNFTFTLWRILLGSFIQGVRGLDAEAFTYALTPHAHPWYFYFRFLYNQLSEIVLIGLFIALFLSLKTRKNFFSKWKQFLPLILIPLGFFLLHQIAVKKLSALCCIFFHFSFCTFQ